MSQQDSSSKRARLDGDGSGGLSGAVPASVYQSQLAAFAAAQHYHTMPAAQATSYNAMAVPQTQQQTASSSQLYPLPPPLPHSSPAPLSSAPLSSASPSPPPSSSPSAPPWMSEVPSFLASLSAPGSADEPTLPDEVVAHLLDRAGANIADPALVRLVGLATQHFLYEVLTDARQIQRLRTKDRKDHTAELLQTDLAMALQQQGISIAKPDFIADNVFAGGMIKVDDAVAAPQSNLAPVGNAARKERAAKK